ncbi:MAG: iron-only hydrogenase system regulator [Eubacterium sp.]
METRIALIGIIVEDQTSVERLNAILHEYSEYIVGRMGIPYPLKKVSVISVVVDAPTDTISALSGKLGMLPHVNAKTIYSKLPEILE